MSPSPDPEPRPPGDAERAALDAADAALIARARTGDEPAFGELMQTHYPATFRLVLAIVRHEHDARDVCQEVWLTVWKTLPKYRGEARFSTWLHPIAVRRAIDHLRKRRRWFDRFLPFASSADDFPGAPEAAAPDDTAADLQAAESRARYERALATLSPRLRAALVLREVEGLSYDEIALALDCPVGTVMSRLHQARQRLAHTLRSLPPDSPLS
jgi:RNA polymerase sigma-70 factor (ECF subfamily)